MVIGQSAAVVLPFEESCTPVSFQNRQFKAVEIIFLSRGLPVLGISPNLQADHDSPG
jgi:hypothetical protein